jgi:hypothetical protein
MTGPQHHDRPIGRRHWIALAIAAMSGCGGGSDSAADAVPESAGQGAAGSDTTAASGSDAGSTHAGVSPGTGGTGAGAQGSLPGTGGTGIYSQGSISAFGSVVINAVHFDEREAEIRINGAEVPSSALRLGMVATIKGERYSDGVSGKAESIDVWSIAQGPITSVAAGRITVMGMAIQVKASTFLDGFGMAVGQTVTVWGLQADAQATTWVATRIAASAAAERVGTGLVSASQPRQLNGVILTGERAAGLPAGLVTRVAGRWTEASLSLEVQSSRALDVRGESVPASAEVELEGVVTAMLSGSRFQLGTVEVDASAVGASYAQLKTGLKVEVNGRWIGQVLKAIELELEDD